MQDQALLVLGRFANMFTNTVHAMSITSFASDKDASEMY